MHDGETELVTECQGCGAQLPESLPLDEACCESCLSSEGPEEGDWYTEDFRTFRYYGSRSAKDVVTVGEDEDWEIALLKRMCDDRWYPNVWRISDHGNCELVTWRGVETAKE